MKKILKDLREKDEKTKEQLAFLIAGILAVLIFVVWIIL